MSEGALSQLHGDKFLRKKIISTTAKSICADQKLFSVSAKALSIEIKELNFRSMPGIYLPLVVSVEAEFNNEEGSFVRRVPLL